MQGGLLVAALVVGATASYLVMRPHPRTDPLPETTAPVLLPPAPESPPVQDFAPEIVTSVPVPRDVAIPPPPPEVVVLLQGAVDAPGIYRLAKGARVHHAIEAAGGTNPDADLGDINLAAHLIDGSTLTVPAIIAAGMAGDTLVLRRTPIASAMNPAEYTRSGWRPAASPIAPPMAPAEAVASTSKTDATDGRININTATKQELETLPGIGPAFADRIIATRGEAPFANVDDLTRVPGIADKRLESLRAHVRVN